MQQIATHVDELKMRLLERTTEFNRIRSLHVRSSQESAALKLRVKEMAKQNEIEKQELQRKLNEVISNKESSNDHFKHFEELTQSVEEYQQTVEMHNADNDAARVLAPCALVLSQLAAASLMLSHPIQLATRE